MTEKMPWLKARLTELGKTPTALAKHLRIAAPRVYEIISGRRHIQPNELKPMAEFLDWTVEELKSHLPGTAKAIGLIPNFTGRMAIADKRNLQRIIAQQPVTTDELKTAILETLAKFEGRAINWKLCVEACQLAASEIHQAARGAKTDA